MVLDLRLIKGWVKALTLFLYLYLTCHTQLTTPKLVPMAVRMVMRV